MSRSSTLSTLVTAALALAVVPVLAQAKDKVVYDPAIIEDEVIVVTPGVGRYSTGERTAIGAEIDIVTTQRLVASNDLDLRYDRDAEELRRRIRAAAIDACNEVERQIDVSLTSDRECIRDAVRDAEQQADALIGWKRG